MDAKRRKPKSDISTRSWYQRRWKQLLSGKTKWILLALLAVLVGGRIALPYIVTSYVNKTLSEIPGYNGHVENIDLKLWRGAYVIDYLEVAKTEGAIPIPFISVRRMDLSIEWAALWHGSLVGEVEFIDPKINFVDGRTESESQDGSGADFTKVLKRLFPMRINSFEVKNGETHFRTFHTHPNVDIHLDNLAIHGTNLTNSQNLSKSLVASIDASGTAMGTGKLDGHLDIDPIAAKPTFNLDLQLNHVELSTLNDFFGAYASVDVQAGTFEASTELAASEGKFTGYVKPLFSGMRILDAKKDSKSPLKLLWEAVVAGVATLLTNHSTGKLGTTIPLSGTFDNRRIDILSSIGGVLKNAFIQALRPGIEGTVDLAKVRPRK